MKAGEAELVGDDDDGGALLRRRRVAAAEAEAAAKRQRQQQSERGPDHECPFRMEQSNTAAMLGVARTSGDSKHRVTQ